MSEPNIMDLKNSEKRGVYVHMRVHVYGVNSHEYWCDYHMSEDNVRKRQEKLIYFIGFGGAWL